MPSGGCGRLVSRWPRWYERGDYLKATLIHLSEEGGGAKGYRLFPRLMRPNCLDPTRVVPSEPGLESFSKESNGVGPFWGPVSIKLDNVIA